VTAAGPGEVVPAGGGKLDSAPPAESTAASRYVARHAGGQLVQSL